MAEIIHKRMFGRIEGDFVLFLIGMRINNFLRINKWFPVIKSMPRMLKELHQKPESGFLGYQQAFGNPTIMIQYWRSFDQLEKYAKDHNGEHYPAWRDFNQKVRSSGVVGIWHEAYKISEGSYESIYNHMPKFGLGK